MRLLLLAVAIVSGTVGCGDGAQESDDSAKPQVVASGVSLVDGGNVVVGQTYEVLEGAYSESTALDLIAGRSNSEQLEAARNAADYADFGVLPRPCKILDQDYVGVDENDHPLAPVRCRLRDGKTFFATRFGATGSDQMQLK